jgi:hypothetical protein
VRGKVILDYCPVFIEPLKKNKQMSVASTTRLNLKLSFDMVDGEVSIPVLFTLDYLCKAYGTHYKLVNAEHPLKADLDHVPYDEDRSMQCDVAHDFIVRERLLNPEKRIHFLIIPIEEL